MITNLTFIFDKERKTYTYESTRIEIIIKVSSVELRRFK